MRILLWNKRKARPHLTAFSAGKEEFVPSINIISEDLLLNVTVENIRKHPDAPITAFLALLLLVFGWSMLRWRKADHGRDRMIFCSCLFEFLLLSLYRPNAR